VDSNLVIYAYNNVPFRSPSTVQQFHVLQNKVFLKGMITEYEVNLCSITSEKFLKDTELEQKTEEHPQERELEILHHKLPVTQRTYRGMDKIMGKAVRDNTFLY
jgi:glutamine amidotransferase-like uncharacterized protein